MSWGGGFFDTRWDNGVVIDIGDRCTDMKHARFPDSEPFTPGRCFGKVKFFKARGTTYAVLSSYGWGGTRPYADCLEHHTGIRLHHINEFSSVLHRNNRHVSIYELPVAYSDYYTSYYEVRDCLASGLIPKAPRCVWCGRKLSEDDLQGLQMHSNCYAAFSAYQWRCRKEKRCLKAQGKVLTKIKRALRKGDLEALPSLVAELRQAETLRT